MLKDHIKDGFKKSDRECTTNNEYNNDIRIWYLIFINYLDHHIHAITSLFKGFMVCLLLYLTTNIHSFNQ